MVTRNKWLVLAIGAAVSTTTGAMAATADLRPSRVDSFPVGSSGPACEAQGVAMGAERRSVFDRKWLLLCADVAQPVGSARLLKDGADLAERMAGWRAPGMTCAADGDPWSDSGMTCRSAGDVISWRVYLRRGGGGIIVVEGLAAYDGALRLMLESITQDRIVAGTLQLANLGSSDALSLVKASAAASDAQRLLGQGYRTNSSGSWAEAAEYFAAAPSLFAGVEARDSATDGHKVHEALINRALQLSNLGSFPQAAALFAQAREQGLTDPVQLRLRRNYEAIDAINRGQLDQALTGLGRALPANLPPIAVAGALVIDRRMAGSLNNGADAALDALLGQPTRVSPEDRARILDAQALQLRGTVLRLQGKPAEADAALTRAHDAALAVQGGRIISVDRLRAQILTERGLAQEAGNHPAEAEADLRRALTLVEERYPDSASVNIVRARLAGFLARHDRAEAAMALYRQVVAQVIADRGALVGMKHLMRPYFDLLTNDGKSGPVSDPAKVAEFFAASQLLEQPGAADALSQLARQLEGGSDQAAALYRRSLGIARELERTRVAIARATEGEQGADMAPLRARLQQLGAAQVEAMSALAALPRYRAVTTGTITLDDLRATLRPGEGYLKLTEVAGALFAVFISPDQAFAWKAGISAEEAEEAVNTLRDSISLTINGVQSTYPFDIDTAVKLDRAVLAPARASIAGTSHLVFEPDGAFLKLPINLLTDDQDGVAAYHARVGQGGDEYDFRGIRWLGRDRAISTALSAASFRDARAAPASAAPKGYLGMGHNVPLGPVAQRPGVRSGGEAAADADCAWPVATWNQPISPHELEEAAATFSRVQASLMTGAQFTDTAIRARPDLDAFRIVHFATHGLVTAPRVGCPVRPALLTSFGDAASGSDGLLSFGEIFDLKLDADLVVLSACDTAAGASLDVTREAGLATGGGQALDGLVRAFIAAGGRQVIASHWPAPDDYNATERLFDSFYKAHGGTIGQALTGAQQRLMDDAATSHPYYWAGFALVGDAARPAPAQ